MGEEISEHSSACHKISCKILWVPIIPGTQMLWVCDFFILFLTYHNFLLDSFCWEDVRQQYTVQLIMGSTG
jgi:hypothetical protein